MDLTTGGRDLDDAGNDNWSIGVFSLLPSLENTLEKFGVSTQSLTTTPYANNLDLFITPTPELKQLRQAQVDNIYETFVGLVAESRSLPQNEVREVANGRIWLGSDAVSLKLADKTGAIDEVIERAAELAALNDFSIRYLKREQSPYTALGLVTTKLTDSLLKNNSLLKSWLSTKSQDLTQLIHTEGPYSFCFNCSVDTLSY